VALLPPVQRSSYFLSQFYAKHINKKCEEKNANLELRGHIGDVASKDYPRIQMIEDLM